MQQLHDASIRPTPNSPWLGMVATGPHRRKGVVQRVYEAPGGVEVALLTHGPARRTRLELQATDLLSAPHLPAVSRADYMANERTLLSYTGRIQEGESSPRLLQAQRRRIERFLPHRSAIEYVRASLIEQVEPGDCLTWKDIKVVAADPDHRRSVLGQRLWMRVTVPREHRTAIPCETDGTAVLPTIGLQPTLDLI